MIIPNRPIQSNNDEHSQSLHPGGYCDRLWRWGHELIFKIDVTNCAPYSQNKMDAYNDTQSPKLKGFRCKRENIVPSIVVSIFNRLLTQADTMMRPQQLCSRISQPHIRHLWQYLYQKAAWCNTWIGNNWKSCPLATRPTDIQIHTIFLGPVHTKPGFQKPYKRRRRLRTQSKPKSTTKVGCLNTMDSPTMPIQITALSQWPYSERMESLAQTTQDVRPQKGPHGSQKLITLRNPKDNMLSVQLQDIQHDQQEQNSTQSLQSRNLLEACSVQSKQTQISQNGRLLPEMLKHSVHLLLIKKNTWSQMQVFSWKERHSLVFPRTHLEGKPVPVVSSLLQNFKNHCVVPQSLCRYLQMAIPGAIRAQPRPCGVSLYMDSCDAEKICLILTYIPELILRSLPTGHLIRLRPNKQSSDSGWRTFEQFKHQARRSPQFMSMVTQAVKNFDAQQTAVSQTHLTNTLYCIGPQPPVIIKVAKLLIVRYRQPRWCASFILATSG